ncbi:MAG: transport-associated protein [Desulfobacterales bacterium GWB2_56_26]|nr:MAG: transport-associated protein [Desulfobacterales bacterium GWB2_56_26]
MKNRMYRFALIATVASTFLINAPLFASGTDDRIESAAKETYVFKTYLQDDNIKMQSKDGLVTLTGTVSEASHKSLAGETVAGLPGVKRVDNKLVEKDGAPAAKSDAWLITKVKTTLLFHSNVNAIGTEVLAENGTITLRGEATSVAQKDLTTEYVMDVEGVMQVNNKMTVANAAIKTDQNAKVDTIGEAIDDTSITALVKATLLNHRSTSALKTTVNTKEGVVTLGGNATSPAAKDLAGKFARDVRGVKKVINNISAT